MTDDPGPWGRQEPAPQAPRGPGLRLVVWLGALAAVGLLVWALARRYPGQTNEDWMWVVRGVGMLAVVSAGFLTGGPIRWREKAKHAAIWAGLVVVLLLGVAYRSDLMDVVQRVRGAIDPSQALASGDHELVVGQGEGGNFFVMGQVNGQPVRFMVDTGASDTVLSPADAHRLGLDGAGLAYDHPAETANGVGYAARAGEAVIAVGPLQVRGVPLVINQAPMSQSLLGMTFLGRLESVQVRGDKLYLRWKG
jgi:aspartyl protease family protein